MRRRSYPRLAVLVSTSILLIGGITSPAFAQAPFISGFSPSSGAVGVSVIISGTAFSGATDVRFNGTSAAFSVDSHTQITSSVPAGATSGPISVVSPHGTGISSDPFTVVAGSTQLVSTSDSGVKGNADSENPAMPADGSMVAFRSLATNLAAGDTDTHFDEYVKDLATGHISLISTSDSGVKGNGDSFNPVFSADGSKVAFRSSSTNLDPGDTDTTFDIYVKTLATGDIQLASTSDTGVKGNKSSYNPFLSADGRIVAFRSYATNLDPGDTDTLIDVYVKNLVTGDI